jgi:hypothetical protein
MTWVPSIHPIPDPWYQRQAQRLREIVASPAQGVGSSPTPPPAAGAPNIGLIVGWVAVVGAAAGIFWMTARGGAGRPVRTNPAKKTAAKKTAKKTSRKAAKKTAKKTAAKETSRKVSKKTAKRSSKRRPAQDPVLGGLRKTSAARLGRMAPGFYRVSDGADPFISRFKPSTEMLGMMTNTRIAAKRSGMTHWLVLVRSGAPRVVAIRRIGSDGKTQFRVEETKKSGGVAANRSGASRKTAGGARTTKRPAAPRKTTKKATAKPAKKATKKRRGYMTPAQYAARAAAAEAFFNNNFSLSWDASRGQWMAWRMTLDSARRRPTFGATPREAVASLERQEGIQLTPWTYLDREAFEAA